MLPIWLLTVLLILLLSDGKLFTGFRQEPNIGRGIGVGLNEGYTQFLTKRYFGNDVLESYEFEQAMSELLELIVGKEKMESLYFNADLFGLIQELKQYYNEEGIMQFISNMDFLSKFNNDIRFTIAQKEESLKEINIFLLESYIMKCDYELKQNLIDLETFSNKLISFIEMLTIWKMVDNQGYNYRIAEKISDLVSQFGITVTATVEGELTISGVSLRR